jgi:hypothetical protein
MTEQDFRREDADLDREHARRDADERHDAVTYTEIFGSAEIAAPVDAALKSWCRSMRIARAVTHDAIERGEHGEAA